MDNQLILILLLVFSFTVNVVFGYKLFQFSEILIKIEDALEESLDILNDRYKSLYDIIQKPIFFDSIEVRQAINDIKISHEAILNIANKLTYESGIKVEQLDEIKEEDSEGIDQQQK